jgi:hypothetical protein
VKGLIDFCLNFQKSLLAPQAAAGYRHLEDPLDATKSWREQHHSVGQKHRFAHIVGDEDDGLPLPQAKQFFLQCHPGQAVNGAERLINQQPTRLVRQRAGEERLFVADLCVVRFSSLIARIPSL